MTVLKKNNEKKLKIHTELCEFYSSTKIAPILNWKQFNKENSLKNITSESNVIIKATVNYQNFFSLNFNTDINDILI